jgi:L-alanine-DL-glutamate epimerase-like enolase superfamily enzyme
MAAEGSLDGPSQEKLRTESTDMPKSMKITRVTPLMLDRYLCVTVETDAGITGLGESGVWGFLEASQAAVEKFGRYLVD